jgi:tetratricopeptide (TPR) repeat protein
VRAEIQEAHITGLRRVRVDNRARDFAWAGDDARPGPKSAAAVASHLVKVEPENEAWWIGLAYSIRRSEGVEKAEAILLRAQAIHPKVAMIAFNLACYASVTGRIEDAKERLRHAIDLDKGVQKLAIDDEDLKPLWDWIAGLE